MFFVNIGLLLFIKGVILGICKGGVIKIMVIINIFIMLIFKKVFR